jgi:threonyl-tRNA synthetase
LLVVGDKEMEAGEIAIRTRSGEDLGKMSVDDFISKLTEEVKTRS